MIAEIDSNEAVLRGHGLTLWLPVAEVGRDPMDKDDRSPCALFEVGEIDAIDRQLARLGCGIGPRLHGEPTPEYDEDHKP